ncbi:putative vacuolar amino acid transporter YPQ1 [Tolypocladium ophioglossoides CBS 100239]|uniref:Putative vacuolar amino acid transporter YPQ1 n=1 Tax=Tolypocladium ophioglossoides (strain CBS 100239) TaxID=1163406 RepID=A0A0L0NDC8_TOLOC|nr:putative vacuolar amino acid transporter YPQ1 [Tolypocladium ophioglossoides CBS 100239]
MAPPTGTFHLDVEAISGICGSISIACWVVVFSPQIIQQFQQGNADGLSIQFVIIWLLGDVFNILGAVLQGVLPTMIILAQAPPTALQTVAWNTTVVVMVCVAGVMGWLLGEKATGGKGKPSDGAGDTLGFNVWGQFFGYLCAVAYIASRMPQLVLNWRRKTTDGLSMLFFLFACLGNVTYVLSIFAYDPKCPGGTCESGEASRIYGRYILVNLSWLAGSLVTLLMDLGIFVQYFIYKTEEEEEEEQQQVYRHVETPRQSQGRPEEEHWDSRPLLQRSDSGNL